MSILRCLSPSDSGSPTPDLVRRPDGEVLEVGRQARADDNPRVDDLQPAIGEELDGDEALLDRGQARNGLSCGWFVTTPWQDASNEAGFRSPASAREFHYLETCPPSRLAGHCDQIAGLQGWRALRRKRE